MAQAVQSISLDEFAQHPDTYFPLIASGDLVKIVYNGEETYLIGSELFRIITKCLQRYEMVMEK